MSSAAQVSANRLNSQASTGPASAEGKQRSSLNATVHGFTGQTVLLAPGERIPYETHVKACLEQHKPQSHEETSLIHQYADQQWTLHQIAVQQMNVLTLMNAITEKHMKDGSPIDTLNAAVAPFYKQVSTLGVYEQRRRRASADTLTEFKQLVAARQKALAEAAQLCKAMKEKGEAFEPAKFGFVCSSAEIEAYLTRRHDLAALKGSKT